MTHVQRRRHAHVWLVLGPLLLWLIATALWARPPRLSELRSATHSSTAGDAPPAAAPLTETQP